MTLAQTEAWPGLDVSTTPAVPFSRLVRVELRKSLDTRAGRWLFALTIGLAALADVVALIVVAAQDENLDYGDFTAVFAFVSSILLPVLGIMLVTSEWSQRTAMVTFSLEPRRTRVIGAKLLVGIVLTAITIVAALVFGAICNAVLSAITTQPDAWHLGWRGLFAFAATQTMSMLGGFALAALLLNTPAAIVAFFVYKWVLPGLFAVGAALMDWFDHVVDWIDFQTAQGPLYDGPMSGADWGHLLVSGVIWLVVPLAIGLRRILRAEVK